MGSSELNLSDCDTKLPSLMPVSAFKATTYDQNQNLFPVAEIFPCGIEGYLYRLPFITARCTQDQLRLHICIFINIYEIVKNVFHEWGYTYKINNISAAFSRRVLKFVLK